MICQIRKSPLSACYVKVSSVIAFIASSAALTLSHTALKSVRSNMAYRIVTCRAKKGPAKKQIRTVRRLCSRPTIQNCWIWNYFGKISCTLQTKEGKTDCLNYTASAIFLPGQQIISGRDICLASTARLPMLKLRRCCNGSSAKKDQTPDLCILRRGKWTGLYRFPET